MMHTCVDVRYNNPGAFIREQTRGFSANALTTTSNDGGLTGQQPLGIVELAGYLVDSVRHGEACYRLREIIMSFGGGDVNWQLNLTIVFYHQILFYMIITFAGVLEFGLLPQIVG